MPIDFVELANRLPTPKQEPPESFFGGLGDSREPRRLWAIHPYQWGPGRVHAVSEQNEQFTLCGYYIPEEPGSPTPRFGQKACKKCKQLLAQGRR